MTATDQPSGPKGRDPRIDSLIGTAGPVLAHLPIAFLLHDEDAIQYANPAAASLFAEDAADLIGSSCLDRLAAFHDMGLTEEFAALFDDGVPFFSNALQLTISADIQRVVRLSAERLAGPGAPLVQITLEDITDLKEKEDRLYWLSISDPATGVTNRAYFIEQAGVAIHASQYMQGGLAFLLIDLDHLKVINDIRGHLAGDDAIRSVAEVIGRVLEAAHAEGGEQAILSRMGGEEFAVLLPNVSPEHAAQVAERIRSTVAVTTVNSWQQGFSTSVSIGLAMFEPEDMDIDGVLKVVDAALFEAKRQGRNRIEVRGEGQLMPADEQRVSRERQPTIEDLEAL